MTLVTPSLTAHLHGINAILIRDMLRLTGLLVILTCLLGAQTDRVRVWQDTITLPTYKEGPPDAIPPFDQFSRSGVYAVYPYTVRLNLTDEKHDVPWRVLNLENQYLHCLVLPDLGGHLYTCRDKISGADMFYANTAMKKADVAPRGAWVAGGIENSFPVAHSRVTVSPVHFAIVQNADGSATILVGAVDRISGMQWRVAYTLRPSTAVLEQKTWLYNPGPIRQPYQWWSNAAIRLPDEGLQFTYPMWVTAPHGAGVLEPWPVDRSGVDRSRSVNYPDALGVFAYGSREPFFAEYNPYSHTGVAHWADPKEVPGKKIWVYGTKDQSYRNNLSDDHSGYAEIQAGLDITQDMLEYLEPQQSRTFSEMWIPSRGTGGISRATPAAILYLERESQPGGMVKAAIDLNVTSAVPHASITIAKSGATLLEKSADLDPGVPFHAETAAVESAGKFRFELKDSSGRVLLAHQEDTYDAVTPAEVKIGQPLAGETQDLLARAGEDEKLRLLDRAAGEYDAELRRSPKSLEVQKAAGRFLMELHRFADAAAVFTPLQRANPSDAEIVYYLGVAKSETGDEAAARPLWESVRQDPRFGLAAQDRLACLLARAGDRKTAADMLHAIAERGPGRAAGLEIALLRRMGQTADAKTALEKALAANPMDSLLRVEGAQLGHPDAAIWEHLAADPEWVLDVADQYFDGGLYQDAIELLDREYPSVNELQKEPGAVLPQAYPLIAYYRGYARRQLGQSPAADFNQASGQSTLYVYPFRASSERVLRAAIEQNPADATAHYLLGCLLMNRRATDAALAEWTLAKPGAISIPAYYETVARVLATVKNDPQHAESLAKEGLASDPNDRGLTDLLATIHRGTTSGGGVSTAPSGFDSPAAAADYALTLLANRNPAGAQAIFQQKNFPQEKQPIEVRQVYAEIWIENLLAAAKPGACEDVAARIDNFAPEDHDLPFTFHGFGDIGKQLRVQFYFGLAEALCGDRKAAERRWSRIAKSKATPASADLPFPVLATALLNPAGSQRTAETALEAVRNGGGPPDKGLRLYVEGMLLRAAGREDEALGRFREGAAEPGAYTRYLNSSAQFDPPLPR